MAGPQGHRRKVDDRAALTRWICELSDAFGPSGHEAQVRAHLETLLQGAVATVRVDALGNLIARRPGPGRRLLMLVPMDEAGAALTHVDAAGRGWLAGLGPLDPASLVGGRMRLASGQVAVVGVRPRRAADANGIPWARLYLDFGGAAAGAAIGVGDAAVPDVAARVLPGGAACGRAMASRAACAAAVTALHATRGDTAGVDLTVAFVVQGELGQRGVRPVVVGCPADWIVAVGGVAATDTPGARGADVRLGGGACLVVQDDGLVAPPPALDALTAAAQRAGRSLQAAVGDGGTSAAGPALQAAGGAAAGALALPVRYRHTPVEVVEPADAAALVDVLVALWRESTTVG